MTDKEIFTKIWFSPRTVFKYINDNKYNKFLYILLILTGIKSSLDQAVIKNVGDKMPLITILMLSIVIGGFVGWIAYYFYAAMLRWTGKWLKGQGTTYSLIRILAYAMIPNIFAIILYVPEIAIFGNGTFQSEIDLASGGLLAKTVYFSTTILDLILGMWSIALLVVGISEVQKLSIWKSILNMLLPGILILSIVLAIIFAN